MNLPFRFKHILLVFLALAALVALGAWHWMAEEGYGPAFVQGNGRLEATEFDIATKLPGRLAEVLVSEGDFVQAGQALAVMNPDSLSAQLAEAQARERQARHAIAATLAQIALRESDVLTAQAVVSQRESDLALARKRLARSATLSGKGAISQQDYDDHQASVHSAEAGLRAAQAQVASARAAVTAARADQVGAESAAAAARATVARVQADLDDSVLRAPRDGRIQLRIAQPGEVLPAGGRVLNMLDLSDVSMTFFVPEAVAGRLEIGGEARIVLDAAPEYVVPANLVFVASQAQFTPRTVETASERQKLMFRVKARIPASLLEQHLTRVKTGLPGVAWVRPDAGQPWPESLEVRLPD